VSISLVSANLNVIFLTPRASKWESTGSLFYNVRLWGCCE